MKTLGIFEAKTKLSEICEEVAKTGEPTEISRRGKPLVRIVPLPSDANTMMSVWDRVADWEARHPGTADEDFVPAPRRSTDRDPLGDYWDHAD